MNLASRLKFMSATRTDGPDIPNTKAIAPAPQPDHVSVSLLHRQSEWTANPSVWKIDNAGETGEDFNEVQMIEESDDEEDDDFGLDDF